MNFKIEQIAIAPKDPERAKQLLADMDIHMTVNDHVTAEGTMFGCARVRNEADLAFNYDAIDATNGGEFEVLNYTAGENWVDESRGRNIVSHLGMHVTAEELVAWRLFFAQRNIGVAQEVMTISHTNEAIKDKRRYNYVIFDTAEILGVDLKFIVRIDI